VLQLKEHTRSTIMCRAMWSGLATLIKEPTKQVAHTFQYIETELEELLVTSLDVHAGFALTDQSDPRYRRAAAHRQRFGEILHQAAIALRNKSGGEDHIDAVMAVVKSIDVYLLEYGENRHGFETAQKGYATARE
jgi:proteasome activator subunit 4